MLKLKNAPTDPLGGALRIANYIFHIKQNLHLDLT